jgi:type II secretory pathway predicted ATPase ExeA
MTADARPPVGRFVAASWQGRPLYADFYGLDESPFDLTPNPRFLYLSARQREGLSNLRYALASSKGFMLMLGDAGTGKTTLVRTALAELDDTPSRYVLITNSILNRAEFYEFLAHEFGLSAEARTSKARFLFELQRDVETRFSAGGLTGLIVDEAQSLPHELLEEIRLLGNIETPTTKLLNIVLCGQPELADRLNDISLRQLKQRIALRCELQPLTLQETCAYMTGRLTTAGGQPEEIFSSEAVMAIFEASRGVPRTINVLCDNALIGGFAAQARPIGVEIVLEVCKDFDLVRVPTRPTTATALRQPPMGSPSRPDAPRESAGPRHPATGQTGKLQSAPRATEAPPMFGTLGQARKKRFRFF